MWKVQTSLLCLRNGLAGVWGLTPSCRQGRAEVLAWDLHHTRQPNIPAWTEDRASALAQLCTNYNSPAGFAGLFRLPHWEWHYGVDCAWRCHAPQQQPGDTSQRKCRRRFARLWLLLDVVVVVRWSAVPGSLQHAVRGTSHSADHSFSCSAAAQILSQGLRQEWRDSRKRTFATIKSILR